MVAVEYPRRGTWTVGFVTREADHRMADGRRYVPVFLPTAPNPTSGWMVLFATDELTEVDLSIEDAVKLVVSAGLVGPDDLGRLSRPSTLGDGTG